MAPPFTYSIDPEMFGATLQGLLGPLFPYLAVGIALVMVVVAVITLFRVQADRQRLNDGYNRVLLYDYEVGVVPPSPGDGYASEQTRDVLESYPVQGGE